MPPLPEAERRIALPPFAQALSSRSRNALAGLAGALGGSAGVTGRTVFNQLVVSLLPALVIVAALGLMYRVATAPVVEASTAGLVEAGGAIAADIKEESTGPHRPAPEESGTGLAEPPAEEAKEGEQPAGAEAPKAEEAKPSAAAAEAKPPRARAPAGADRGTGSCSRSASRCSSWLYALWNWERLEVFKFLLASFFPLAILILAVLGSIVFGFATPTEAAAVGAFGGFILAAAYRFTAQSARGQAAPRPRWRRRRRSSARS